MIRTERVSAAALRERHIRLDGSYYCSVGARARELLARSDIETQSLVDLCMPDGLYIPPRFKRPYVRSPDEGIPYITGSSIGLADPVQGCSYLSRNPRLIPHRDRLMLQVGTILVSCSGDTGNVVYVNDLFAGMVGSPDLLRVIPDTQRVLAGYLYAFLASPLGHGLLTQGTYGGVVPHIESAHVVDLPVPRLGEAREGAIHKWIEEAATKRTEANRRLTKARERLYDLTCLPKHTLAPVGRNLQGVRTFTISSASLGSRLEARFHDIFVRELQAAIRDNPSCGWAYLHECADPFLPPRGKWINVEAEGVPLISSGEMFLARPKPGRMVSLKLSPVVKDLIVEPGDVLVARSGQIYSILGDVIYVGRSMVGNAVTEDAIRVRPDASYIHPGYLYAFLSLPDYGYGQIVRTAYGTSIPHVYVGDLRQAVVPIATREAQDEIGAEVERAIELRDAANELEDEAQTLLQQALEMATGMPWPTGNGREVA